MRRKEERSKQGQTNNKAKQRSTPKAYTCTCSQAPHSPAAYPGPCRHVPGGNELHEPPAATGDVWEYSRHASSPRHRQSLRPTVCTGHQRCCPHSCSSPEQCQQSGHYSLHFCFFFFLRLLYARDCSWTNVWSAHNTHTTFVPMFDLHTTHTRHLYIVSWEVARVGKGVFRGRTRVLSLQKR